MHCIQTSRNIRIKFQLAILYAIPLLLFVALPFLPETPRWLLLQGEEDSARRSLTRLRPSSFTASQIDEELAIIQEAIRIERKIASSVVWKDIWKGADLVRIRLLYYMASSDLLTEEDAVELCVRDFPSIMWYKFCYCMCVIELYLVHPYLMLAFLI